MINIVLFSSDGAQPRAAGNRFRCTNLFPPLSPQVPERAVWSRRCQDEAESDHGDLGRSSRAVRKVKRGRTCQDQDESERRKPLVQDWELRKKYFKTIRKP